MGTGNSWKAQRWSALAAVVMIGGVGIFLLGTRMLERNEVRATVVEEVRTEPGAFVATRDRRLDGLAVRAERAGRLYAIEDHFLYTSDDQGETFQQRGVLPRVDPTPMERIRGAVARHPLTRRLRQNVGPVNVVVLSSGTILVMYDHIYRSEDGGETFEAVGRETLAGVFSAFDHGVAVDDRDQVFFGEYRTDARPHAIRLLVGRNDGRDWSVCHTFDEGAIFHVHSVSYDPVEGRVVVASGDLDRESGLFALDADCRGVERIGGGDQRWRVLAPLFTEERVVWGSDDDRTGAAIHSKARGGSVPERNAFLGKPAYFGVILCDGALLQSTVYEPDSEYTTHLWPDPAAEVWISREGLDWHILDAFPWKEEELSWGRSRAQAALVGSCDAGQPYLFVTPRFTEDGLVTYRYRIDWTGEAVAEPPGVSPSRDP